MHNGLLERSGPPFTTCVADSELEIGEKQKKIYLPKRNHTVSTVSNKT